MITKYYYSEAGNDPKGPVSLTELHSLHQNGQITDQTWVIAEGSQAWTSWGSMRDPAPPNNTQQSVEETNNPSSNDNNIPPNILGNIFQKSINDIEAMLWLCLCFPIGFMRWGQTAKGWVWVLIALLTCGMGGFLALGDYWMNYTVQKTRPVGEWEFFPTK